MLSIGEGRTKIPQPLRDPYDLDHIDAYGSGGKMLKEAIDKEAKLIDIRRKVDLPKA